MDRLDEGEKMGGQKEIEDSSEGGHWKIRGKIEPEKDMMFSNLV